MKSNFLEIRKIVVLANRFALFMICKVEQMYIL